MRSYTLIFFFIVDDSCVVLRMGRQQFLRASLRTDETASPVKVSSEGAGIKQPPTAGIVAGIALAQA